ncbi:MAG: hypothetical protein H0W50_03205 [Parachlamydiaceae bacterium]|nr:hypothetical protein [Parachlamydiaceae bacterium]
MKIISSIPQAVDPISTEQLTSIVQKIKSYSNYWAERRPTNFQVLHFADACSIGTARVIYVFSKDAEHLLQIPKNLRDLSDKVIIAVDEEIFQSLTRDGIERGRQIYREGMKQSAPKSELLIEFKDQNLEKNAELIIQDQDAELHDKSPIEIKEKEQEQ